MACSTKGFKFDGSGPSSIEPVEKQYCAFKLRVLEAIHQGPAINDCQAQHQFVFQISRRVLHLLHVDHSEDINIIVAFEPLFRTFCTVPQPGKRIISQTLADTTYQTPSLRRPGTSSPGGRCCLWQKAERAAPRRLHNKSPSTWGRRQQLYTGSTRHRHQTPPAITTRTNLKAAVPLPRDEVLTSFQSSQELRFRQWKKTI